MTIREKKEWLSRAFYVDRRIKVKLRQIDSLTQLATTASQKLSEMPRCHSGYETSRIEEYATRLADLETEIKLDISALADLKREVIAAIKSVSNPEYELVLEMRYLQMMSWEEINDEMGYGEGYIYKIHRNALGRMVIS